MKLFYQVIIEAAAVSKMVNNPEPDVTLEPPLLLVLSAPPPVLVAVPAVLVLDVEPWDEAVLLLVGPPAVVQSTLQRFSSQQ